MKAAIHSVEPLQVEPPELIHGASIRRAAKISAVTRYEGHGFTQGGRIAVVANDAIGNFVMATPLLQMLRAQLAPSSIEYWGGKRTWEFQRASDLFEWSFPLHGSSEEEVLSAIAERPPYDLIVNIEWGAFARGITSKMAGTALVCGPCDGLPFASDERGSLWQDQEWVSEQVTERYPFLRSGFIGEIFCRLAYLEGTIPPYKVPSTEPDMELPDLLIATAASLPEKLWPIEKWSEAIGEIRKKGRTVGLIGAKPSVQSSWKGGDLEQTLVDEGLVEDLRGAFTLPQVVGALERVSAVFTLDNGILHLAVAASTPTVGLFRHGIHRLWAPPSDDLAVLTSGEGKEVADIEVDRVLEAVERAL